MTFLTINAPLIFENFGYYFFGFGQTTVHNGPFLGIFRGGLDFFDPKIVPSAARDNLEVKKSLGKNTSKN